MPHIALGQANTSSILAFNAVDSSGSLYDPASVTFSIWDLTAAAVKVHPAGAAENVTVSGRLSKGRFYAYDVTGTVGWTPAGNEGLHEIRWAFKDSDAVTDRTWSQKFYVSSADLSLPKWSYITPNEIRGEGLTIAQCSNARLTLIIQRAQDYIERSCRQPFRPIYRSFALDGNGSDTIHFPLPIIGIEEVKINSLTAVLDSNSYEVYNIPTLGADSWALDGLGAESNPRICMSSEVSIYSGALSDSSGVFSVGRKNQKFVGVFGRLDSEGNTPSMIRYAAKRLVYSNVTALSVSSGGAVAGPVKREKTDRHEVEYFDDAGQSSTALSTSPEVEEILALHRAPVGLGAASDYM